VPAANALTHQSELGAILMHRLQAGAASGETPA
jgi:hypothetical protein